MSKHEEGCGMAQGMCHCHEHCSAEMQKEFKLAMLKKKEKMLEAKLEFIREMKSLVEKMPEKEEMDD